MVCVLLAFISFCCCSAYERKRQLTRSLRLSQNMQFCIRPTLLDDVPRRLLDWLHVVGMTSPDLDECQDVMDQNMCVMASLLLLLARVHLLLPTSSVAAVFYERPLSGYSPGWMFSTH